MLARLGEREKSMERTVIETNSAPKAIGPYSQAIMANGFVFTSGQIPLDPATGAFVGEGDVRAQAERVMENLRGVLTAAGTAFARVIKTNIFLADMGDFATVNEVYARYFEGIAPPARSTVQVAALPKGALVEIEMVALSA